MSLRSNGSYIGPRPTGPSTTVASGIWDLRTVERQRAANAWPFFQAGDPYFSSVSLLLRGDGANSGNTITDSSSSGKSPSTNNNVTTSTSQSKFGGASLLFNGSNTLLQYASSADFSFGTGDFCIEFWIYLLSRKSIGSLLYNATTAEAGSGLSATQLFYLNFDSAGNFLRLTDQSTVFCTSGTISLSSWHHVALVRSSGSVAFYLDGTGGITVSCTNNFSQSGIQIGYGSYAGAGRLDAHLDDLRITKGVARYTANFTPPTAAFPDA